MSYQFLVDKLSLLFKLVIIHTINFMALHKCTGKYTEKVKEVKVYWDLLCNSYANHT